MAALHTLAKVPRSGALADALAASLAGAPFLDTIFYAPAQLLPSGEVRGLRAVYANGGILEAASPYFRNLLSDTPRDDLGALIVSENAPHLEGGGDGHQERGDDAEIGSVVSLPSSPGSVASLESMLSFEGATAESAVPETVINPRKEAKPDIATDRSRVVHLHTVPASTLEAAIFYIYTGEVYFLPLRSRGTAAVEKAQALHSVTHPGRPACSPKSMYQFAREAELDELRDLAEANLFSQLDESNILAEVFSPFSSQYPSILKRQFEVLLRNHWTSEAQAALAPLVARIVRGELPHAAPALTMLLLAIPASPPTTPPLSPVEDASLPRRGPTNPASAAVDSTFAGAARHCGAPEPRPASPVPSDRPLSPCPAQAPRAAEEEPRDPLAPTAEVPCALPWVRPVSESPRAEALLVIPPCGTPMAEPASPLACDKPCAPSTTSAATYNGDVYDTCATSECEPMGADAPAAHNSALHTGKPALSQIFNGWASESTGWKDIVMESVPHAQDPKQADDASVPGDGEAYDTDARKWKAMSTEGKMKKMMMKKRMGNNNKDLHETGNNGWQHYQ